MKVDYVLIALIIIVIAAIVLAIYRFIVEADNDEKIKAVKEWLLFCVTKMESIYGSSTGKIKLRAAWDLAIERFPFITLLVTFEEFSEWVDEALEEMKQMLGENETIKRLVLNNQI